MDNGVLNVINRSDFKMTFEDFLDESQVGYSTIETRDDLKYVIKRTWNAAIQASRDSLDRVEFPGNAEALWFRLDEELRKLLTAP